MRITRYASIESKIRIACEMGPVIKKKVAAITYVYQSVYLLLLTGLLVYVVNVIFGDSLEKQKKPGFLCHRYICMQE